MMAGTNRQQLDDMERNRLRDESAVTDPQRRTLHNHDGNRERGDSVEMDGGNIHQVIDRLEDDMADIRAEFERLRIRVLTLTERVREGDTSAPRPLQQRPWNNYRR